MRNDEFLKCFNLFNNYFDWSCDYIGFIYFNIICNMQIFFFGMF